MVAIDRNNLKHEILPSFEKNGPKMRKKMYKRASCIASIFKTSVSKQCENWLRFCSDKKMGTQNLSLCPFWHLANDDNECSRVFLDTRYNTIHSIILEGELRHLKKMNLLRIIDRKREQKHPVWFNYPALTSQNRHNIQHKVSQKEIRGLLSMNFSLIQRKLNILFFFGPLLLWAKISR